jgi:hypothetical protein
MATPKAITTPEAMATPKAGHEVDDTVMQGRDV